MASTMSAPSRSFCSSGGKRRMVPLGFMLGVFGHHRPPEARVFGPPSRIRKRVRAHLDALLQQAAAGAPGRHLRVPRRSSGGAEWTSLLDVLASRRINRSVGDYSMSRSTRAPPDATGDCRPFCGPSPRCRFPSLCRSVFRAASSTHRRSRRADESGLTPSSEGLVQAPSALSRAAASGTTPVPAAPRPIGCVAFAAPSRSRRHHADDALRRRP